MKRTWLLVVVAIVALGMLGGSQVFAGDGQWMVRTRLIQISPDASGNGELQGTDVDGDFTVEADFTYFFRKRWAVEVIAATASHDVTVPDIDKAATSSNKFSLGSASILPPTVTLQYHFQPDGKVRPYIGAGINYTIFYDQTGVLDTLDDLDNSFGFAGQVGVDFMLNDSMSVNLDLKYIQLDTDVSSRGTKLGTLTVDPWIFGVGFGWRF